MIARLLRLRHVPFDRTDPDPYTRLDRMDGLDSRRRRAARAGRGPQPVFDQMVDRTGITPEPGAADVDALLAELDLLALPIITGTLSGHGGRVL